MAQFGSCKYSVEEAELVFNKYGYGIIDFNDYKNSQSKVIIKDNEDYLYKISLRVFKYRVISRNVFPEKFNKNNFFIIENIKNYLLKNNSNFMLISNVYNGSKNLLELKCKNCDCPIFISWDSLREGARCSQCNPLGRRLTKRNSFFDNFPLLIKEWDFNKNINIDINKFSFGSSKKVWWICGRCGHSFESNLSSRTRLDAGCPSCAGKITTGKNSLSRKYPSVCDEWNYNKNIGKPDDYSRNYPEKVSWICSICKHEYECTIHHRIYDGTGCPKCNQSHGEKSVSNFLSQHDIENMLQHTFPDCRNQRLLPFDFCVFLGDNITIIEYHGKQHYEPIKWFGGIESFELLKLRDKIKSDYCKNNNISMITIPYWDFNNIEEILTKEFNL